MIENVKNLIKEEKMIKLTPYVVKTPKMTRLVIGGKIELPDSYHGCIAVIKDGIRIFQGQMEGLSRLTKTQALLDAENMILTYSKDKNDQSI